MLVWLLYLFLIGTFICIGGIVAFGAKFLIIDAIIMFLLGKYTYSNFIDLEKEQK